MAEGGGYPPAVIVSREGQQLRSSMTVGMDDPFATACR